MKYVLAYDLGTGGIKTSLFDEKGKSVGYTFLSYETSYPKANFREQRPDDWWECVVKTTRSTLEKTKVDPENIVSLAVSGHSLGVVPISREGELLCEYVPIWNDARAVKQADEFFSKTDEDRWYLTTGNGFPPELYSSFKIMWYKENLPEMYGRCHKFIGTKDYINFRLTNVLCTDHSYASGSGVYSLADCAYSEEYITLAGIDREKLPEIRNSTDVLGTVLPETAKEMGLSPNTMVCCGGVDNACMALGAACTENGEVYTSLGTSAWIAVCDEKPVLDTEKRPYVFAHCIPGKYVSATCIFSAGNSLKWVRDNIFADFLAAEKAGGENSYKKIDALAAESSAGARGLLFIPALAGGSSLDKSANLRGSFTGLDLMHTRQDMARAALEGISINLRLALDVLQKYVEIKDDMLIVGGGANSKIWRSIFADVYEKNIITGSIAQDAGSLGACIVAGVGAGLWDSFGMVKNLYTSTEKTPPKAENSEVYRKIFPVFSRVLDMQCDAGDMLSKINSEGM